MVPAEGKNPGGREVKVAAHGRVEHRDAGRRETAVDGGGSARKRQYVPPFVAVVAADVERITLHAAHGVGVNDMYQAGPFVHLVAVYRKLFGNY